MVIIAASLYLPEHITTMASRAWFYYAGDDAAAAAAAAATTSAVKAARGMGAKGGAGGSRMDRNYGTGKGDGRSSGKVPVLNERRLAGEEIMELLGQL
jgi:hypothetical protein